MIAKINSHFKAILMDGAPALKVKSKAPCFSGVDFSCKSNISYMLYRGPS